jgi:hypothetical protein
MATMVYAEGMSALNCGCLKRRLVVTGGHAGDLNVPFMGDRKTRGQESHSRQMTRRW